jgi:hypothetical protein
MIGRPLAWAVVADVEVERCNSVVVAGEGRAWTWIGTSVLSQTGRVAIKASVKSRKAALKIRLFLSYVTAWRKHFEAGGKRPDSETNATRLSYRGAKEFAVTHATRFPLNCAP